TLSGVSEVRRVDSQTPRRVARASRRDALEQMSARIVYIDDTKAGSGDLVVAVLFLFLVGEISAPSERNNIERRVVGGHVWIDERARHFLRREVGSENIDLSPMEVRRI